MSRHICNLIYEIQTTSEAGAVAGAVAALAERKKKTKYEAIAQIHLFYPIALETSGVFGPDTYAILCDLATSKEPNSIKGISLL